jgi:ribosome biogenesis GTPase
MKSSHLVVAGDIVDVDLSKDALSRDSDGVVRKVLPRQNVLERPGYGSSKHNLKMKAIAANIDHMIIVVAPKPVVPSVSIDQLIVAASHLRIKHVSIVMNKSDMDGAKEKLLSLEPYSKLGYPVISYTSVAKAKLSSVLKLREIMTNRVSIFVGQSGVGKSSIINTLIPDAEAVEGELVNRTQLGSHTTSNATLYHLPFDKDEYINEDNGDNDSATDRKEALDTPPDDSSQLEPSMSSLPTHSFPPMSCLIDSPGIRELMLWHVDPAVVEAGFKEISEAGKQCRFRNCTHDNKSSGCAVRAAVAAGSISEERYRNYFSILSMKPKR